MATVMIHAVASLDGYIADPHDEVGRLFDWYGNGDVELRGADPDATFHVSRASAELVQPVWDDCRAVIMGRRMFDLTHGWNGVPVVGEAVFVVTHEAPTDWGHPDAPFTFVTEGVEEAVRQATELAGDGTVAVCAGNVGGQVLEAGLADVVAIDVVPVVFGAGKRYFGDGPASQMMLEDPEVVVPGDRVLHLRYRVPR